MLEGKVAQVSPDATDQGADSLPGQGKVPGESPTYKTLTYLKGQLLEADGETVTRAFRESGRER